MPSSSCFYLYTENLSLPVFLLIFAYKKDTCQNMPVSLLHFFKISYPYSIKVIEISSVFTFFHIWYGNSGTRLTWSNLLTLAPSGFATLPFNRFAFKIISFFKRTYHAVFRTSIIFLKIYIYFTSVFELLFIKDLNRWILKT